MKQWITEYANAADCGAPYVGPTLLADSEPDALALAAFVRGPNGETMTVCGELLMRGDALHMGDTFSMIRRLDS